MKEDFNKNALAASVVGSALGSSTNPIPLPEVVVTPSDPISLQRLNALHPKLRAEAIQLFNAANAALTGRAEVRIVQGLRTFKEQADLYAQGRTKPGQKVTNASAGTSFHNYGLAIDFALLIDGKSISWEAGKDYDGDNVADWMEVVKVFKEAGWKWGGEFKTIVDRPHLEKTFGYSWRQLLALHDAKKVDKSGYVLI